MVSDVNKLADLVELDAVPAWVRTEIDSKKDEILRELQSRGTYLLQGPDGEQITITANAKVAAA